MNREKLLEIINQQIENKNIVKHMLAAEACMRALAKRLGAENQEEWAMAGLIHDLDYQDNVPPEKHGTLMTEILAKEGIKLPENILHAIAAHNWHYTGVKPESLMDWALFTCDSLTGLIVACALVKGKKLANVTVETVLKKFPDKRFAAGTRREDIKMCQEKLGIPLEEFIEICLRAMQEISDELGL